MIKNPTFQEISKNWLYRNIKNKETFSVKNIIESLRNEYKDIWFNIRENQATGTILDVFISFKSRIERSIFFILELGLNIFL